MQIIFKKDDIFKLQNFLQKDEVKHCKRIIHLPKR